jgi:hypothetical protein
LTDASRDMTLEQFAVWWNNLDDPKICTNASTYADIKGDIEQLCSFNNVCTYEMKENVEKISAKLAGAVSKASKWRKKK